MTLGWGHQGRYHRQEGPDLSLAEQLLGSKSPATLSLAHRPLPVFSRQAPHLSSVFPQLELLDYIEEAPFQGMRDFFSP